MTIEIGQTIPEVDLFYGTTEGPAPCNTGEMLQGKKTVLFSVPGAFTPTCSARHVPGYVEKKAEFDAKGVDQIICMSVNDAFVMDAWAKDQNAHGAMKMLADGNGAFAKALGLEMDGTGFGMGHRAQRFAMVINDGKLEQLHVEAPGAFEVSAAEYILERL